MSDTLTQLQQDTLNVVMSRGQGNPITGKAIASNIGLKQRATGKEGADLRSIINALRVKGYPICATGNGYWWPKDSNELTVYIASFEGRIASQQDALEGMRKGFLLIGKSPEEVRPQKLVPVLYEGVVYHVSELKIEAYMESHPGAERV